MIQKQLVQDKLKNIDDYLHTLEPLVAKSASEIAREELVLHTIERLFQLIVDTMVDINTHIITAKDFPVPDDFQSTFIVLGKHDVLPMEFALKISPVVGLRNRVVHKYEDLNTKLFFKQLKDEFDDFRQYLKYISDYISK